MTRADVSSKHSISTRSRSVMKQVKSQRQFDVFETFADFRELDAIKLGFDRPSSPMPIRNNRYGSRKGIRK